MNKKIDKIWPALILLLPGLIILFFYLADLAGISFQSRTYSDVSIGFVYISIYLFFAGPIIYILLRESEYKIFATILTTILFTTILFFIILFSGYRLF